MDVRRPSENRVPGACALVIEDVRRVPSADGIERSRELDRSPPIRSVDGAFEGGSKDIRAVRFAPMRRDTQRSRHGRCE